MSNVGSEYVEKLILIVIAFVVGGLLLTAMNNAFDGSIKDGAKEVIENVYNW